jgi:hypothetical protein
MGAFGPAGRVIGTGAGAGPKCGSFASSATSERLAAGAGEGESDEYSGNADGESETDGVGVAETVFIGPQPATDIASAMPSKTTNREERTGKG